jgi:hypothetical protein
LIDLGEHAEAPHPIDCRARAPELLRFSGFDPEAGNRGAKGHGAVRLV